MTAQMPRGCDRVRYHVGKIASEDDDGTLLGADFDCNATQATFECGTMCKANVGTFAG